MDEQTDKQIDRHVRLWPFLDLHAPMVIWT